MALETILQSILEAAYQSLNIKPGRSFIQSGSLEAWDDCCEGQLALKVTEVTPILPDRQGSARGCIPEAPWRVGLALAIVRCSVALNDDGTAPDPSVITEEGVAMVQDMQDLYAAITCTVPDVPGVLRVNVNRWQPIGPSGGCAGGEWRFDFVWGGTGGCR